MNFHVYGGFSRHRREIAEAGLQTPVNTAPVRRRVGDKRVRMQKPLPLGWEYSPPLFDLLAIAALAAHLRSRFLVEFTRYERTFQKTFLLL